MLAGLSNIRQPFAKKIHIFDVAIGVVVRSARERRGMQKCQGTDSKRGYAMTKLLAFVCSAILAVVVFASEASALRAGGIRTGGLGVRGISAGGYRGAWRGRHLGGYRAAAWRGRPYWRGGRRYGYGLGLAALGGAYYGYGYYGSPAYGYSSTYSDASFGAAAAETKVAAGPGTCGTYLYWKDGKCNDARSK
jgi:hypothetical protein